MEEKKPQKELSKERKTLQKEKHKREVKSIGSDSLKGRIDRMIDAPFLIRFILPHVNLFLSAGAVPHRFLLFLPPLHSF